MSKNMIGGSKARAFSITKTALLFLLLLVYIVPFFLVIINSLKGKRAIIKNPLSLVDASDGVTFSNFSNAWETMRFPSSFMNSFLITVVSVFFIILFASMTAYLFVRTDWLMNKVVFALMMAGMVIPFQAIMIPMVSIYGASLNLLNSRATLIFLNIGFGMGMAVFIYHGFIKSNVPISLEEAAKLDGCNKLQTFFLIVFPLLQSITATLIVLDVLWLWNDYLLPSLVLSQKELFTLPLSTFAFYDAHTVDYGGIMASLILTMAPVLILYFFLQKQIISGVVSGAVKS